MKYLVGFILLMLLLARCSKGDNSYVDLDPSTSLDADLRLAVECQQLGKKPVGKMLTMYRPEQKRNTAVYYFDRCE